MANAASLNPEDHIEGGGLIDDVDVEITEARFDMFDYNGKAAPAPALRVEMVTEEDEKDIQYYSVGNAASWAPSDDGSQIMAIGKDTALRMTTNCGILLKSLIDAGFPGDKLGDDISILDGLKCHVLRIPAPKRSGLNTVPAAEGEKKFEKTILIVSEILTLPWEKAAKKKASKKSSGGGAAKKKAATKKAVPAEDEADLNESATEAIMGLLAENDGSITKKELAGKLFQSLKGDSNQGAIVKLGFNDEFLSEGPWDYEDGTLTM